MTATLPEIRILNRAKAALSVAPIADALGLEKFTVRHHRHRSSSPDERPGVAIQFIGVERDEDRGPQYTLNETCWILTLRLIVELGLPSEESDQDPSGWGNLLLAARACATVFTNTEGTGSLKALVDDVALGAVDPDDASQPEKGRLEHDIHVLYRTPVDNPLVLLTPEENA